MSRWGAGLIVKNVVLCFDADGVGNASGLKCLLDQSEDQVTWYHRDVPNGRQREAFDCARTAVGEAYEFVSETWAPGDRIFVFGSGRGGYYAHALTRLLGTVGVLPTTWSDLVDFALSAYALPRTPRTPCDWWRVRQLIEDLNDDVDTTVPVAFLGTWDAVGAQGLPPLPSDAHANVVAARHALAIDHGPLHRQIVPVALDGVEAVWFRGGHCDIAGGPGACEPLTGIAVDWVLDGAKAAGVGVRADAIDAMPVPGHADALAGSVHGLPWRKPPVDASVHASIGVYLQAHPEYWRRLPSRIVWADEDWIARGERLVTVARAPVPSTELEAIAS
ncbi:MAG: DUF2235 domain-containing protein [Mycobacterium sp.]